MPCGGNQPHVVYERLGIGAEPESERRGHGDLQVGVPRHQHLLVLFAQALQPVEQRFYGVGRLAQFVAQEKFEVHQHLIVARAARMDLLARVAQPPREHQLHLRVDVLGVRLRSRRRSLSVRRSAPPVRRRSTARSFRAWRCGPATLRRRISPTACPVRGRRRRYIPRSSCRARSPCPKVWLP